MLTWSIFAPFKPVSSRAAVAVPLVAVSIAKPRINSRRVSAPLSKRVKRLEMIASMQTSLRSKDEFAASLHPGAPLCSDQTSEARRYAMKQADPLSIARQGYLFAGGKYSTVNDRQVISGQLYAEFQIPSRQTHPWPIVMIHGGSQSGTNFTGTPDGREGWAQFFLRQGYAT